jgi:hypothetical protein
VREIVTKVYPFAELSDKAKKRALDKFRDVNTDHNWWDFTYEEWKESLREKIGIEKAEIQFSGFSCQGDGASFTGWISEEWIKRFVGERRDRFPLLAAGFEADDPTVEIREAQVVRRSSMYVHEMTCYVSLDVRGSGDSEAEAKAVDAEVNRLDEEIEAIRLDLCREIYRDLEREHDYLTGDEAIIETIEANEYEFDEAGNWPPRADA